MIIQIVKFQSNLSLEEVQQKARARATDFRGVPGLLQKYYVRSLGSDKYAGVYIWDSTESMTAYRDSKLAASIPKAYQVLGPPEIELYEVAFTLRD